MCLAWHAGNMTLRLGVATLGVTALSYVWDPLPVMIGVMVVGVVVWHNSVTLTYTQDE